MNATTGPTPEIDRYETDIPRDPDSFADGPTPETPTAAPQVDPASRLVIDMLGQVLSNPHFIAGLAFEVDKARRQQQLYPFAIKSADLNKPGVIACEPKPINGVALVLTRAPIVSGDQPANTPAFAVMVRHQPIPKEERSADPRADYAKGMDIITYQDHPFDLNQRIVMDLGGELHQELRRQLLAINFQEGQPPAETATSAFYFLTMLKVGEPPQPASEEGAANGRAG